jgi:hypothetical protein
MDCRPRCIARDGPGSEKLSGLQLQLLDMEPGVTGEEVQAESYSKIRVDVPEANAAKVT